VVDELEYPVLSGTTRAAWGPVGGGREPGESVQAALERELAEEAGEGC
jgi:8-oxo-dGTP pyrophosphatase MutT (NUDIX family)